MNDRDLIYKDVRDAIGMIPKSKRAPYPDYPDDFAFSEVRGPSTDNIENFKTNFNKAHGILCETIEELAQYFLDNNLKKGYCDPAIWKKIQNFFPKDIEVLTEYDREKYDDYEFGITKASGAIGETGTLILKDTETSTRLGALSPWVHVACLDKTKICRSVSDAIKTMEKDPNIIWVTGPSKTADIEGILIEGVHGPGKQLCLFLD